MRWRELEHACPITAIDKARKVQISSPIIQFQAEIMILIYRLPKYFQDVKQNHRRPYRRTSKAERPEEELSDKIQTQKDDIQKILDTMDDEAQEVASSSSRAAKAARGIASSSLNHQDTI